MADNWTTDPDGEAAFANYETDSEPDEVELARQSRIAAARAEARSYSAKIEEPRVSTLAVCVPGNRVRG